MMGWFLPFGDLMAKKAISSAQEQLAKLNSGLSDQLINDVNTKIGKAAYSLSEGDAPTDIKQLISTGSTILDTIITNGQWANQGGFPVRRLVEISGNTSAGKSMLANHVLVETQKIGGIPILIDVENTTEFALLRRMGMKLGQDAVDAGLNKLVYVSSPKMTVTRVFDTIEMVIKRVRELGSDKLITVVWDSIAATPDDEEIQATTLEQQGYGTQKPKLISQAMRKVTQFIGKEDVLLIFTNQLRQNMNRFGHGDQWITPGGQAVPFHSSVRIRLRQLEEIKRGDIVIGVRIEAKTKKNKIAPAHRTCTFDIYFDKGIDDVSSWFDNLVGKDIILKEGRGSWYTMPTVLGEEKFQRKDWHSIVARDYLKMRDLVVKANVIDYTNLTPTTLDDLQTNTTVVDETDEEGVEIA